MTKLRIYELTDKDLPPELATVKEVWDAPNTASRRSNESLHDYFMRKGFTCYCRECSHKRQLANNAKLEL